MNIPDHPPTDYIPPVSILITRKDGYLYVTPSRKVDRIYAIGLLSEAANWVANNIGEESIDPAKCFQQVSFTGMLSIDDYGEVEDFDDDDWDDEGMERSID